MEAFVWAFVALAFLAVANYRVGQFINPPLEDEMKTLKQLFEMHRHDLLKISEKVNSIMVDKGFRND